MSERATMTSMIPPANEELTPNESLEVKAERRAFIAEKVAEFLASGGKPEMLPSCTFSPEKYERKDIDLRKPSQKVGVKDVTKKAPDFDTFKKVKI